MKSIAEPRSKSIKTKNSKDAFRHELRSNIRQLLKTNDTNVVRFTRSESKNVGKTNIVLVNGTKDDTNVGCNLERVELVPGPHGKGVNVFLMLSKPKEDDTSKSATESSKAYPKLKCKKVKCDCKKKNQVNKKNYKTRKSLDNNQKKNEKNSKKRQESDSTKYPPKTKSDATPTKTSSSDRKPQTKQENTPNKSSKKDNTPKAPDQSKIDSNKQQKGSKDSPDSTEKQKNDNTQQENSEKKSKAADPPKEKQREHFPEDIPDCVLNHQASPRTKALAKPHEDYFEGTRSLEINPRALNYTASPRMIELSKPNGEIAIPYKDRVPEETIKRNALTYKASKRICELAEPSPLFVDTIESLVPEKEPRKKRKKRINNKNPLYAIRLSKILYRSLPKQTIYKRKRRAQQRKRNDVLAKSQLAAKNQNTIVIAPKLEESQTIIKKSGRVTKLVHQCLKKHSTSTQHNGDKNKDKDADKGNDKGNDNGNDKGNGKDSGKDKGANGDSDVMQKKSATSSVKSKDHQNRNHPKHRRNSAPPELHQNKIYLAQQERHRRNSEEAKTNNNKNRRPSLSDSKQNVQNSNSQTAQKENQADTKANKQSSQPNNNVDTKGNKENIQHENGSDSKATKSNQNGKLDTSANKNDTTKKSVDEKTKTNGSTSPGANKSNQNGKLDASANKNDKLAQKSDEFNNGKQLPTQKSEKNKINAPTSPGTTSGQTNKTKPLNTENSIDDKSKQRTNRSTSPEVVKSQRNSVDKNSKRNSQEMHPTPNEMQLPSKDDKSKLPPKTPVSPMKPRKSIDKGTKNQFRKSQEITNQDLQSSPKSISPTQSASIKQVDVRPGTDKNLSSSSTEQKMLGPKTPPKPPKPDDKLTKEYIEKVI